MTGPEHYQEAERLLAKATGYEGLPTNAHVQDAQLAQAHATLALAAAVALGSRERDGKHDPHGMDYLDRHAWEQAVAVQA